MNNKSVRQPNLFARSTMRPPRGRFVLPAAALLFSFLLLSCGSANEKSESNTFFFNIVDPMKSLDPVQITQQSSWWIGEMVYAGLIGLDEKMQPIPKIARSWEVSPDGLLWTFHLRNDVRFGDDPCFPDGKGRVVTAADVRYSFERLCRPDVSRGFWIMRGKVEGADEYYNSRKDSGKTPLDAISGLEAADDTTFRIRLREPFPPFLYMMATPFCYIVPKEAVEKYGQDFSAHPVGAGPFRLTMWKPNQELVLVRNGNYFERDESGNALPYLDSVRVSFTGDPATVFAEFDNGNIDLITTIDPAFAAKVLSDDGSALSPEYQQGGYRLYALPAMSIDYYGFTLDTTLPGGKDSPFARNRYLRRAINYGIDRDRITKFVLKGLMVPAHNGPVPPSTPGFSGVKGYTYDPELARALLDSAGYPNGKGLPPFTLQLGNTPQTASVAEAVQEDLRKLGLQMTIKQVDFSTHLSTADDGKIPFWRTSWLADYPHAENFMANFYSPYFKPSGPNRARYSNPTVDSLYRAALKPGLTQQEWSAIYGQAERIVLDDAPWVFLYYSGIRHLAQPWITGYAVDPLQRILLTRVRKGAGSETEQQK